MGWEFYVQNAIQLLVALAGLLISWWLRRNEQASKELITAIKTLDARVDKHDVTFGKHEVRLDNLERRREFRR